MLRSRFNLKCKSYLDQNLGIVNNLKLNSPNNSITSLMLRPTKGFYFSIFILICSLIPQYIFLYRLISNNVSSGDWYLARQLISIAKIRIETLSLIANADFMDPISSQTLFGNKSFSNGLQILSPDTLLYGFMSDSNAVLLHFLFVNAIAIFFIIKIGKLLKFNNLQVIVFGTVWLNCGSLVGRLSEGHIQLLGYNLIPGFFYYIFIIYRKPFWLYYINLGFFLGLIALLGSTHVYFQMCLILLLIGITTRQNIIKLFSTLIISICSAAPQILPTLIFPSFNSSDRSVYEGYGYHFIEKFFSIPDYSNSYEIFREAVGVPFHLLVSLTSYKQAIRMNGWEWTLYIGVLPLLLSILIIFNFRHQVMHLVRKHYYVLLVFILSVSIFYRVIFLVVSYFINTVAVDRIPYRMMIYVFFLAWLFVCYKLKEYSFILANQITIFLIFLLISYLQLVSAAYGWFNRYEIGNKEHFKIIISEDNVDNYDLFVKLSILISLSAWLFLIIQKSRRALILGINK